MNAKMVTLDGAKLQEIATANETAIITAQALQERSRNRMTSDITRMRSQMVRDGKKILEADYVKFWKDLQTAGVGSIVYGRRGKPDRFDWHFNLKNIGKAMLDGSNEKVEQLVEETSMAKKSVQIRKPSSDTETIHVSLEEPETSRKIEFVLPSGGRVEMKVPKQLSEAEANAVARELKKLSV